VHHVGSASPRIVADLAARHPDSPVPQDPDELERFFSFTDFAHFIDVYLATVGLLRTDEDVRMLTYEVARDLAAQQVRYAELTMTPYTSVVRGIPIEAYTEAIEDARVAAERDHGVVLRWIYDIPGESGLESADATLTYALGHRPAGARRLRARRARDRRATTAVRAALRRRAGSRAAQRAALRGVHWSPVGVGTPSPTSGPSASATGRRQCRIPSCSSTSPITGSRSRCARPATSRPASSSAWT
jgi:hypothetical protein